MGSRGTAFTAEDQQFMARALALAEKGLGRTSPNPMVGAVVVRDGVIIGEGWHRRAGGPHAEVHALSQAREKKEDLSGATLYVTLEPCSTFGRTPPCTEGIIASGIKRVVVAAKDPNPKHGGGGFRILRKAGIEVSHGLLAAEAARLNEAFNHWIVLRRPFVTLKSAMSLDGKIATNSGESKWITGRKARVQGMRLRLAADAIAVGINTVLRDDPALTLRNIRKPPQKRLLRFILDPEARISPRAQVLTDAYRELTTLVVTGRAPEKRIRELETRVRVMRAPSSGRSRAMNLTWFLNQLGAENITSLLVEGGGETHAWFLRQKVANRVSFFYAPAIITGRYAPKTIAGDLTFNAGGGYRVDSVEWKELGRDLFFSGTVRYTS